MGGLCCTGSVPPHTEVARVVLLLSTSPCRYLRCEVRVAAVVFFPHPHTVPAVRLAEARKQRLVFRRDLPRAGYMLVAVQRGSSARVWASSGHRSHVDLEHFPQEQFIVFLNRLHALLVLLVLLAGFSRKVRVLAGRTRVYHRLGSEQLPLVQVVFSLQLQLRTGLIRAYQVPHYCLALGLLKARYRHCLFLLYPSKVS